MSYNAEEVGGVPRGVLAGSDSEKARISDYLLLVAAAVISITLIGLGALKLVELF